MSKVRRSRHQRHTHPSRAGKPLPGPAQVVPPFAEARADDRLTGPLSEPFAGAPQERAVALPMEAPSTAIAPFDGATVAVPELPLPALSSPDLRQETPEAGQTTPRAIPTAPEAVLPLVPVPLGLGAEALGTTVMTYVIGEGAAMSAHWHALAGARTVAEILRLQIGEFQRAAEASLTCWGMLTLAAGRSLAPR